MKSSVYEVVGCMGSQSYVEKSQFDTMREARIEAKKLNKNRADMQGKNLRDFMSQINNEGKFFTGKS